MRVLLLLDSLVAGGAQRQATLLFNEWRRQQVDAWLVTYWPADHFLASIPEAERHRVRCLDRPPGRRGSLLLLPRLRAHLGAVHPQVVVSFLRTPTVWAALARLSGRRFRLVASERSAHLGQMSAPLRAAYLSSLRVADRVVPNSFTAADELAACGLPADRIQVIPNGVPLVPEMDAPRPPRGDRVRLLMVGSLLPVKNHAAVLRALRPLAGQPFQLDVVGRTEDPAFEASLRALAAECGLSGQVVFHGAQRDVGRFFREADLLIHPSLFEGFPNVLLEAWAWGCPVLVSDRADLPRLVEDGRTGRVVSLDDPAALSRALAQAIRDPAALLPLAAAGKEGVSRYSLPEVAHRWTRLCGEVADGPGLGARLFGRS
jgi:glycosyltransferase involved in cell wall biosynthesis